MIPGLHLPPKPGAGPRISWLGSLRPSMISLRPAVEPQAAGSSAAPRLQHWHLALAGVLACTAVAGAAWTSHSRSHVRVRSVQSVVSGRAGPRKTSSGVDERWTSAALTVTVDPTLARATPSAKDAIMNAFGAWVSSGVSLPQISFDTATTSGEAVQDGVNRLLLGPITVPDHEQDLAITISYADTTTGEVVEADTIFNSAYDWTSIGSSTGNGKGSCDSNRYDLQNVATHEAGHFFGLGEDYDDKATTMYVSSLPCQTSKRALTKPDVSAMSGLYAQGPASAAQSAACTARIAGGGDAHGGALAALGLLAFAVARRRRVA